MAQDTMISWARHTHNEWIGCEDAGPECAHCYARKLSERFKWAVWGKGQQRHLTSASTRQQPYRWDRAAAEIGEVHVVFSASLSDWADTSVPREWVYGLFRTIRGTPNLFWMLLTKRPKVACTWLSSEAWWKDCFGDDWAAARAEVMSRIAIGTSVGTVKTAQARLPWLWRIRGVAGIFVSMAPLLEYVDLTDIRVKGHRLDLLRGHWYDDAGLQHDAAAPDGPYSGQKPFVIVEGESGKEEEGNRPIAPLHPDIVRSLRDICAATATDFHFKQWGEYFVPDDGAPACRACGCTWNNACAPDRHGFTCSWVVEPAHGRSPLCSRCTGKAADHAGDAAASPIGSRPVKFVRVGTKQSGRLLDGVEHVPAPSFLPPNGRISSRHAPGR